VITLPEGTQASQIEAEFEDGLVVVTVREAVTRDEGTKISLADKSDGVTRRAVADDSAG
jgi:HSP20 family molecular chaperone IbpA